MNILFIGDIVGAGGRKIVIDQLPALKSELKPDIIIANGENAAHGKGITSKIYRQLINAGIDVITLGNHAFSKSEILKDIDKLDRLIRPKNMNPLTPGKAYVEVDVNGTTLGICNLYGQVFMENASGPWKDAMDEILDQTKADVYFVDFHGETTGEKQTFLYTYFHRVSAIVGTHTHVQTADNQVMDGCAFICDVGMCGVKRSILGRDVDEVLDRTLYHQKTHYTPATGPTQLNAVLIEVDEKSKRALSIQRIVREGI